MTQTEDPQARNPRSREIPKGGCSAAAAQWLALLE
jgi:hypothetical protein